MIDEAVTLQDQALPDPDPGESAAAYKLRLQPFIEQLAVKAAIAPALKQEADGQRVTALSLGHKLETAKETVVEAKKTAQVMRDLNQFAPTELRETGRLAVQRRDQAAAKAKAAKEKSNPQKTKGGGR